MDISVIIVNYNTKQLTAQCISSVKEYTHSVEYEIIVVDNASTDGSREHFHAVENIIFLPQKENLGFGKANNKGLEVAKGKYIFFLNSDTYLRNNALKLFFDFAERQSGNVGCMGCLLRGADGKYTHSFGHFPNKWNCLYARVVSPFYSFVGKKYSTLDDKSLIKGSSFSVDYVTGADLFVRKELLDKLGAFDPDFFMYYEETEMQHRFAKAGCRSVITTTPDIIHLEGASMTSENRKKRKNYRKMMMVQRSQFLYFKKTGAFLPYVLFRVLFFLVRLPFLLFSKTPADVKMEYFRLITFSR